MKKFRAVVGIILPFVFWLWRLISFMLLMEISLEFTTNMMIVLWYMKTIGMIWTLIGLVTMVIGVIYLGRENGLKHKDILSVSWGIIKKNIWKFALWLVLIFVLQIVQDGLSDPNVPATIVNSIIIFLISLLYLWVDLWLKSISLSLINKKATRITGIFVDIKKYGKYLIAYIISAVFIIIGVLLFIVPGIIVSFRLKMVPYLILEKDLNPWKAVVESWKMTKWYAANIFALNVLLWGINILGLLALFVGLFVTVPLYYVANADLYKKLSHHKK